MAHIEIRYCCPVCNRKFIKQTKAIECRNTHEINIEKWAVGKEKSVRIYGNNEEEWALKESDVSDFIEGRKLIKEH